MWYKGDADYADSRLRGTVVKGPKFPVYVLRCGGGGKDSYAQCKRLGNRAEYDEMEVKLNKIDLSPFRLGYTNYKGVACYVLRIPLRHDWHQGIRERNLGTTSGTAFRNIGINNLEHMLIGKYPALKECIKLTKIKGGSMAWHYDWAVDHNQKVWYKGTKEVGKLDGEEVKLNEKYAYLQERLEEVT